MAIPVTIFIKCIAISVVGLTVYGNRKSFATFPTLTTKEAVTKRIVQEPAIKIVDNYKIINGTDGVPVEYWYNETSSSSSRQHVSSPGCPRSIDGYPWVHYGTPPRCFLVSFKGPCAQGQKITLQAASFYGICACECFSEYEPYQLSLPNLSDRYIECFDMSPYPNIYDKVNGKCYRKFHQGPCSNGTIIANATRNFLTCLPICNNEEIGWENMEENGLCVQQPIMSSEGAPIFLPPGRCPLGQKFSFISKKCINANALKSEIVG